MSGAFSYTVGSGIEPVDSASILGAVSRKVYLTFANSFDEDTHLQPLFYDGIHVNPSCEITVPGIGASTFILKKELSHLDELPHFLTDSWAGGSSIE